MKMIFLKKTIFRFILMLLVVAIITQFLLFDFGANASNIWDGETKTSITSGAGTSDDPFRISSASELAFLAQEVNRNNQAYNTNDVYLILTSDIYLNDVTNWQNFDFSLARNNLNVWIPIGTTINGFQANLDGRGFSVKGLFVNDDFSNYQGLFSTVSGNVSNLGVVETFINVSNTTYATGGIVGRLLQEATLTNSFTSGVINSNASLGVGGLVGLNEGTILNSFNVSEIYTQSATVGGVVGRNDGMISNCFNTGKITSNSPYIGGIVGLNQGMARYSYFLTNTALSAIGHEIDNDLTRDNEKLLEFDSMGLFINTDNVTINDTTTRRVNPALNLWVVMQNNNEGSNDFLNFQVTGQTEGKIIGFADDLIMHEVEFVSQRIVEDIPPQKVLSGDEVIEPQNLNRFDFQGWFTSDGHKWDFDFDIVTSDITLEARWTLSATEVSLENALLEEIFTASDFFLRVDIVNRLEQVNYSFQWYKQNEQSNFISLNGQTSNELAVANVSDSGIYKVVVTARYEADERISEHFFNVTILPKEINKDMFGPVHDMIFSGQLLRPHVTSEELTLDSDFKIEFINNINVGIGQIIITGINNFTSEVTLLFTINPMTILEQMFSIPNDMVYTGTEIIPEITTSLISGVDFNATFSNNISVGTGFVYINAIGNYTGSVILQFEIWQIQEANIEIIEELIDGVITLTAMFSRQNQVTFAYQWFENINGNWEKIVGATNVTLNVLQNGQFRFQLTASAGGFEVISSSDLHSVIFEEENNSSNIWLLIVPIVFIPLISIVGRGVVLKTKRRK